MDFYWLLLGILAVWRVSHLLAAEDGPWNLFERMRRRAGDGFFGGLLNCLYCASVWVSLPFAFALGNSWKQRLMMWPALSAGAIIVERCIHKETTQAAAYIEDREDETNSQDHNGPEYHERSGGENEHVLRQR